MLWKERQEKIEQITYDSLEKIAEEIGVKVPYYPEVYWIGNKLKFEGLGIPNSYKKEFIKSRKRKESIYLVDPKIILIGGYFLEDIGEEAGHFLHLNTSKIKEARMRNVNDFCLNIIIEMFGFFCSKIIKPSRKNPFSRYKDYLSKKAKERKIRNKINSFWGIKHRYDPISEVYQQGYGLGEKLFNAHISKEVPKKKIKKLFMEPFNKKNEALLTFIGLKYNLLEFMNNY